MKPFAPPTTESPKPDGPAPGEPTLLTDRSTALARQEPDLVRHHQLPILHTCRAAGGIDLAPHTLPHLHLYLYSISTCQMGLPSYRIRGRQYGFKGDLSPNSY